MTKTTSRHSSTVRSERARARALAADLSSYTTTADLLELSAILNRHDESEAAEIRELIDLTRAA